MSGSSPIASSSLQPPRPTALAAAATAAATAAMAVADLPQGERSRNIGTNVGGQSNVQDELTARANDIRDNESSTPLLGDTSVPEAHILPLDLTKDHGRADVCPYSDRSLITNRVKSILQELLQNEANYVQTLGRGIENYVSIMGSKELPPGLRGQRYHIFGNIEKIHRLHRDQLLPMLERNQASIQGIAETFIRFLEHDKFYCYIMFALNRPKSERICNRNLDFFQRRQTDVDDNLCLESFLLQPIQRLPRYNLLLAEINKEIRKQMKETLLEAVKDEIDIMCKAENQLKRFINIVNEAMSINDIQECYEIDLFDQGKFRKMLEVDIYDWHQQRRYPATMFLFERSVIYTEKGKTYLDYRGRYDYSEIGLYTENHNKVYLFARERGIREIEVHCSDTNEGQCLSNHVEGMMARFTIVERKPLLDDTSLPGAHNLPLMLTEDQGRAQYDERNEFFSTKFKSYSSNENLASDHHTLDVCPYSDRSLKTNRVKCILKELLQNEANYVQTLGRGIENYVSIMDSKELPPGLRGLRYHIFGNIEKIHSLHRDKFLPMLERNQASIQGIAETFIHFLEHDKFYCYIMFALNGPKSERIWRRNLDFFQRRQDDVNDKLGLSSFLLQPIQRLPRYMLLLAEINKEILKQTAEMLLEAVKDEIAILCKAEKRLKRFIDIVNEAMSINDIQECYEINLFHQGKFRKMLEVDIYDWDQRRRYPAKMFLFEQSVIYTEKGKAHLEYRGRYDYSEIGIYTGTHNKVNLFAKERGVQDIKVYCSDMNQEQSLSDHVERMMTQFALREKESIRNRGSKNRTTEVDSKRNHIAESLELASQISSLPLAASVVAVRITPP